MTRQFNRANQNRRTGSQAKAGVTSRGKTGEMEPPSGAGRQEERRKNRRKKQRQMHLLMLALVIVVGIVILAAALRKNGEQIFVDDTYAVTIRRGKVTAEDFTKSVEAQLAASLGTSVQINETITFTPVRASKEDIVTTEYALSTVCSMVTYQVEAAVVTVDGGEVLALATEQEAQSVLDQIINEYIPEGTEVAEKGFVENVEIRKKFVDSRQIVSTEQAYATLTAGTPATETYTVTSGDTLSIIASKNNIAVEDILEANPTMTITTPLQIGDKGEHNVRRIVEHGAVKHLGAHMGVDAPQVHMRQLQRRSHKVHSLPGLNGDAEFGVHLPGGHRLKGVGVDARGQAQQGLLPDAALPGQAVHRAQLVHIVDDKEARAAVHGEGDVGVGLGVAVEKHLLHGEARLLGQIQLPGGDHIRPQPLLGHDLIEPLAAEGLAGVQGQGAGEVLVHVFLVDPAVAAHAPLIHQVQRRPVLPRQLHRVPSAKQQMAVGRGNVVTDHRKFLLLSLSVFSAHA